MVAGSSPAQSVLEHQSGILMEKLQDAANGKDGLLGGYVYSKYSFPGLDQVIAGFQEPSFRQRVRRQQFTEVNKTLLRLIQQAPEPAFLLPAVLEFMELVNRESLFASPYNVMLFEFWLNGYSGLDFHQNLQVRAKIIGKKIPREEYGAFFPIGMGKVNPGTHFVVAHLSPDMDTTIASFVGWLDAFGARVGDAQHYWAVPGGPFDTQIVRIFDQYFGSSVFQLLCRQASSLTLNAMDLIEQQGMSKEIASRLAGHLDHGDNEKAIVYIDDEGHYLGDWRSSDVEPVRHILMLLKTCIRWFENNLHSSLISLFARKELSTADLPEFLQSIFTVSIEKSDPVREYTTDQCHKLRDLLVKVFGLQAGLQATYIDLIQAVGVLSGVALGDFQSKLEALGASGLFDEQGRLIEDRPAIFNHLVKIIDALDRVVAETWDHVDRLDIVMRIKQEVLGLHPEYALIHADVEELRSKMRRFDYLTIVFPETDGKLFPIGIVSDQTLRKEKLGTVSQRDFCNLQESKMASYLEVISVVDHHKANLATSSAAQVLMGDAQSSNVLIAEIAFRINDRYSVNGMTEEQIDEQLSQVKSLRVMKRLLERKIALHHASDYYIHPQREFAEYLFFIYAILDDTDLLSKVTHRDVEAVVQLLNRLKSLAERKEIEVINLDDIPKDKNFAKSAAERILRNPEMYSIYAGIYRFKEQEVVANLDLCAQGLESNIFADTKEQNGCCRIGQTKLFAMNFAPFDKVAQALREHWLESAKGVYQSRPEMDFHLHMISTISSADEVYHGVISKETHRDELWLWAPNTAEGYERLARFLSAFQDSPELRNNTLSLEFPGPNADKLDQIFTQNFRKDIPKVIGGSPQGLPIAILRFDRGSLNSRKSMITPYLPRQVV